MLVAANSCTAVELRRAAALDELRDQNGGHCAPESLDVRSFAEPAVRENEESGTAFKVGKGETPFPLMLRPNCRPPSEALPPPTEPASGTARANGERHSRTRSGASSCT